MYILLLVFFILKLARDKWLLKRVHLIEQYGTIVGIEPVAGFDVFMGLYKAHELLRYFLIGLFFGWNFVVLASI